ncbi:NFACT family protein [Solibacillus sp. A46]|uniref:Rqc2 homolog RqcH n=1 Tax=Solibacillus faecavium TaxID=2762221 RepID=A0ABR8XU71_9BACL|nr:NFACT RNA binding domain-containing protein [Solibacillus faecavium]MBD8035487.1 NFACT family protein [Solibacillus faecavium]
MAFDGLFTRSMSKELQNLTSGRITKIYQPNALEVVLQIRAAGQNVKLLFSIHPSYSRIHLTNQSIENPADPPMFCMLLRKHLEGGFIQSVVQDGFERVITLEIDSKNEIGDAVKRKLIIEIMGRHSNLLLIDSKKDTIIDSLKHLPPSMNSFRTVLPGQQYIAPPKQQKVALTSLSDEEIKQFFSKEVTTKEIIEHFAGFSPLHATELLHRLSTTDAVTACRQLMNEIATSAQPTYVEQDGKIYFSPTSLTHLSGVSTTYETLGELLDRVFFARAKRDRVKQQAGDLERWLQNELNKLKLKQKKLQKDYERAQNLEQFQLYGELLMANLYNFSKGAEFVDVENYYSEQAEKVRIPVSPRKSPIENAQSYYTKYNKAKTALIMIEEQKKKAADDIDYLEMLTQQVQQASPADIEEIREELAEQGLLRIRQAKRKKKPTKPDPEKFTSSTGVPISVGKNNKQNDYLTFKIGKRNEIWLHTKDIPGSHVVIHSENPDETTLKEAAMLCAYFSKARDSSSVPVDYTEIRHVKKPNGAKPGFVIYFEQKTIYVTPDEAIVMQLKK